MSRTRFILRVGVAMAVAIAPIGCADDSPSSPTTGLSQAETETLVRSLATAHAFDGSFGGENPWPCPAGGIVSYSTRQWMDVPVVRYNVSATYGSCRVDPFRMNGELSLELVATLDPLGRISDITGHADGTISWELEERSGSCRIDLAIAHPDGGNGTVRGSVCGTEIAEDLPRD